MRTKWIFLLAGVWGSLAGAMDRLPCPADIFEVNERRAFVMKPGCPADGSPWVWYAPTLKHYPHASQQFYFDQLLEHGIAVAGYDLGEVRGAPGSSAAFTVFYEAMVAKGYSSKPILLGQSRGGLMLLCWAFRNPEKVKAFAGIYPVCNLTSWPMRKSKAAVLRDYGLSEDELIRRMDLFNPLANMAELVKKRVPMFLLHGDADRLVPLQDNSSMLKEACEQVGGLVELKIVPGKGHAEVPEFFRDQELLDFFIKQTKGEE